MAWKWLKRLAASVTTRPKLPPERTPMQIAAAAAAAGSMYFSEYPVPDTSRYELYRKMSRHPTLALVRAIVYSPVIRAGWSYVWNDDVPTEMGERIQRIMERHRTTLVRLCLRSLEYGWQPAELVWKIGEDGLEPARIKALDHEHTTIRTDDAGNVIGLVYRHPRTGERIELDGMSAFYISHNSANGGLYGESRHESARLPYEAWMECQRKANLYHTKAAGILCQIHYPIGRTRDTQGVEHDNAEVAKRIADAIAAGKTVYIPNLYATVDDPRSAAELAGKGQWVINFVDTSAGAGLSGGFIEERRYQDSLMFRAWLRPERSGLEGRFGTKAEAETHSETGAADGDSIHGEIVQAVQEQVLNPILEWTGGPSARDSVRIRPAPMSDPALSFKRELVRQGLTSPTTSEALAMSIDWDAVMDDVGVPKSQEVIDLAELLQPPVVPQMKPSAEAMAALGEQTGG